jgi:hypothetical protein
MSDMGRRDFIALLGGAASHSKQTNDRAMSTCNRRRCNFCTIITCQIGDPTYATTPFN